MRSNCAILWLILTSTTKQIGNCIEKMFVKLVGLFLFPNLSVEMQMLTHFSEHAAQ